MDFFPAAMRSVAVLACALAIAGCRPTRLAHGHASSEELARAVLSALENRDRSRLAKLAISELEFEHRIWPELPAAQPERNMPWSYVWLDLRQKSDATLERTLHRYGGQSYRLETVKFEGAATNYGAYRVYRDTVLVVRDSADRFHELRIVGSVIEAAGEWKVFSYVVDS